MPGSCKICLDSGKIFRNKHRAITIDTVDMVYTVDAVDAVDTVDTVDMVYTVDMTYNE